MTEHGRHIIDHVIACDDMISHVFALDPEQSSGLAENSRFLLSKCGLAIYAET
jgi:hypothetical protein